MIEHFGRERLVSDLRPDDFAGYRKKLVERFGVVSLKNEINRCTILFNHAHNNQLIDKPVSYGSKFDRPSSKALQKDRNEAGAKLFERTEVLAILDAADVQMRAMILLGLNGALGNSDIANLRESHIVGGWLDYPRVKTETPRRIPLWQETRDAIQAALAIRPDSADPSAKGRVFLTRQGRPWVRVKPKAKAEQQTEQTTDGAKPEAGPEVSVPVDVLSQAFGKILHKLAINGRRGLGFYCLRHCFETYAGESKDQVAVDAVMGHVDSSMAANYRHGISDGRLRAVVGVVRDWLFTDSPSPEGKQEGGDA